MSSVVPCLLHDSHFGHDKSIEIRPYANLPDLERPTMFYAGDGVSDLSAAKETDLLFAKKGHGNEFLPLPASISLTSHRSHHILCEGKCSFHCF